MEIKTGDEIKKDIDFMSLYPIDKRVFEYQKQRWVKVDDEKDYISMRIEKYKLYCIKNHYNKEIQCACHDVMIELLRVYNELSQSNPSENTLKSSKGVVGRKSLVVFQHDISYS